MEPFEALIVAPCNKGELSVYSRVIYTLHSNDYFGLTPVQYLDAQVRMAATVIEHFAEKDGVLLTPPRYWEVIAYDAETKHVRPDAERVIRRILDAPPA